MGRLGSTTSSDTTMGGTTLGSKARGDAYWRDVLGAALGTDQYPPIYGNPMTNDGGGNGLANLEVGKFAGRKLSVRFRCVKGGVLNSVNFYVKTGAGYSLGTNGSWKVDVQGDDGTANHFPDGSTIATVTAATPSALSPQTFTFGSPPTLVKGRLYHFVLTNPDASPTANYSSEDDVATDQLFVGGNGLTANQLQPGWLDTDLAMLWQDTAAPWVLTVHTPIFRCNYSGGATEGQCYNDALSGSALFNIFGTNWTRERFTVTGGDRKVTRVWVRVRKLGTPAAALTVKLISTPSGAPTTLDTLTLAAATVTTSYAWYSLALGAVRTLANGTEYAVELSSPLSANITNDYQEYPLVGGGGAGNGWTDPSVFSDGLNETTANSGTLWTAVSPQQDLQMFFT